MFFNVLQLQNEINSITARLRHDVEFMCSGIKQFQSFSHVSQANISISCSQLSTWRFTVPDSEMKPAIFNVNKDLHPGLCDHLTGAMFKTVFHERYKQERGYHFVIII